MGPQANALQHLRMLRRWSHWDGGFGPFCITTDSVGLVGDRSTA